MKMKKHIDDVQMQTVDEHFKLLLEDDSVIDSNATDVTPNDLPDWYNKNLYKEGQNYYKRNTFAIVAANTVGIILAFTVKTILKVLVCTQRSSSTCSAFKRYIETATHIHNIYTYDQNDTNSKWYKSMNVIRWHHKISSKKSKNADIGEITQRDMALTQFDFMGFIIIASESFGVCNTLEEEEAFNHFWRVNGYMLGISDRFNICRRNAKETIELCQKIKNLYATYLSEAPTEFYDILKYTLDAFWYIDITINKDAFMYFIHKLLDLPYKKLGWYSWLLVKYREWMVYLCFVPYVSIIVKLYIRYLAQFILWNAENFPILAWMKFGIANVRLNLYPKYKQL